MLVEFKKKSVVIAIVSFIALFIIGYFLVFGQAILKNENNGAVVINNLGGFKWPEGKKAAISLSFDDGRKSQIDLGLRILNRYGVKASFYVSLPMNIDRVPEWKKAISKGHEIGNHSLNHPCSVNYSFYWGSGKIGLEDYTNEMMHKELDQSNAEIEQLLGVRPKTFAYPCGQTFIGRGGTVESYIPMVAEQFIVGRGWLNEGPNIPAFCDLSQVMGMPMDNQKFASIKKLMDTAVANGQWLVLVGHDVGGIGAQSTDASTLAAICKYAKDPGNGVWIDTVQAIGSYVQQEQSRIKSVGRKEAVSSKK